MEDYPYTIYGKEKTKKKEPERKERKERKGSATFYATTITLLQTRYYLYTCVRSLFTYQ